MVVPIYAPTALWGLAARRKKACLVVNRYLNPVPKGAEGSIELLKPSCMVQAKEPINRLALQVQAAGPRSALPGIEQKFSHGATGRRLPPVHPGKILRNEFLTPMRISVYELANVA
jgi:hypothetical protein